MPESDLMWMAGLMLLPAVFAIGLILIPTRWSEAIRWWACTGAAATLAVALSVAIGYYNMLDSRVDKGGKPLRSVHTRLDHRADQASHDAARAVPRYLGDDWVARRPWVERFDIDFALGVDGIGLSLILLAAVIALLAIVASWKRVSSLRGYFKLILLFESGVIGTLLALDFFLFFVCYQLASLALYLLLGRWGTDASSMLARAFAFYSAVSSVLLMVAMIVLHSTNVRDFVDQEVVLARTLDLHKENPQLTILEAGERVEVHTFDLVTLVKAGQAVMLILDGDEARLGVKHRISDEPQAGDSATLIPLLSPGVNIPEAIARLKAQPICSRLSQYALFASLLLGFAIHLPLLPLYGWLRDCFVASDTPVSMLFAGIWLALGGYGLIRIVMPICPFATYQLSWLLALIGVLGSFYGSIRAYGATDLKKLIAYWTLSQMGVAILGLASWCKDWEWGLSGGLFLIIAQGLTASALFAIAEMIEERVGLRELLRVGGVGSSMPRLTALSAVIFFCAMGLPGLCVFWGVITVFTSAVNYSLLLSIPAIVSIAIMGYTLARVWRRIFWEKKLESPAFGDLTSRETALLAPLAGLAALLGLWPSLILNWMEPSAVGWVENLLALKR